MAAIGHPNCALFLDCFSCLREGCYLVGVRMAHGYTEMCVRPDHLFSTPGEIDIVIEHESVCGGGGITLGGTTFLNPKISDAVNNGTESSSQLFLVMVLVFLLSIILVLMLGWFIMKRRMRASLPGV